MCFSFTGQARFFFDKDINIGLLKAFLTHLSKFLKIKIKLGFFLYIKNGRLTWLTYAFTTTHTPPSNNKENAPESLSLSLFSATFLCFLQFTSWNITSATQQKPRRKNTQIFFISFPLSLDFFLLLLAVILQCILRIFLKAFFS